MTGVLCVLKWGTTREYTQFIFVNIVENKYLSMKTTIKPKTPTIDNTSLCPVLGQTYYYFDDGEIRPSRRSEVVITEIIPFDQIDEETLNEWKQEVEDCHWLYAKETDFFVKADLKVSDDTIKKIVFARTPYHEWFSLGWWGGILDIDGSLNALLDEA